MLPGQSGSAAEEGHAVPDVHGSPGMSASAEGQDWSELPAPPLQFACIAAAAKRPRGHHRHCMGSRLSEAERREKNFCRVCYGLFGCAADGGRAASTLARSSSCFTSAPRVVLASSEPRELAPSRTSARAQSIVSEI